MSGNSYKLILTSACFCLAFNFSHKLSVPESFIISYHEGFQIVHNTAQPFVGLSGIWFFESASKEAKSVGQSKELKPNQPCVTVIDIIGIALFLTVVIAHFLLCRKGPYSRMSS